ncbi:MAG: hypothetical protein NC453_16520, partial [Muribaculum sp.]|nr:hypothetical protein [Muribaculum sp.]
LTHHEKNVYLSLFTPLGFKPVDIAEIKGEQAVFHDIEPEVLFFPTNYNGKKYTPCGHPFMLQCDGSVHVYAPDSDKQMEVKLSRKMPIRFILKERVATLDGCRIETATSLHGPWTLLHTINAPKEEYAYFIPVADTLGGYLRIVPPDHQEVYISEIIVSTDSLGLNKLKITPINENDKEIADGDILSWKIINDNICVKIENPAEGRWLAVSSYNDDNYIVPGDEYELQCYTDNGAISLGMKTATDYFIKFNAPENAVLRLRNHTKGVEEQVFIYKDGCQRFNIDLRSFTD